MKSMLSFAFILLYFASFSTFATKIVFLDPRNDDKGTGKITYPTDTAYQKGDFDLTKVTIEEKGENIVFKVRIQSAVRDIWKSKSWGGNGFSLQFVQIYIDQDRKEGSGHTQTLPGLNAQFAPKDAWDKVVLISPQGTTRLNSEINLKASAFKKDIVVPTQTYKQGKTLVAVVSKSVLGSLSKKWGFQVIMQSNEGFPRKKDLLTRPVNEYNGSHRFGGGNDGDCDPHVIDMLAGNGKGKSSEKALQYKILSNHVCGKNTKLAIIPMVTP